MTERDLTLTLMFDASPASVFDAVTDVRGWWSEGLVGASRATGDEFTYRHRDVHRSVHRVIEAVPGERVVWRTLDADLSHAERRDEWIGTEIRFEIARRGERTELRFTHVGLRPELTCYGSCSRGWQHYVGTSLKARIETGRGRPDDAAVARPTATA